MQCLQLHHEKRIANNIHFVEGVTNTEPQTDDRSMSARIVFAVGGKRDRQGDIVRIAGIQTDNHQRNPVAMLEHGKIFPLPIGLCKNHHDEYTVTLDERNDVASAVIHFSQSLKEGEQCYELWKEGILRGGSIGFRPIETDVLRGNPRTGHRTGHYIKSCELLEVTITGLPANGEAVAEGARAYLSKSMVCGKSLASPIRGILEEVAVPLKTWTVGERDWRRLSDVERHRVEQKLLR